MIKQASSLFFFRFFNKDLPSHFQDFLKQQRSVYNTRSSDGRNLQLPHFKTKTALNSILFKGPKTWNDISSDIKFSVSFSVSKRKIKELLLSNMSDLLL